MSVGFGAVVSVWDGLGFARGLVDLDNLAALASTFDTLVAVLENRAEIIVQGAILFRYAILRVLSETKSQLPHSICVVLVCMLL